MINLNEFVKLFGNNFTSIVVRFVTEVNELLLTNPDELKDSNKMTRFFCNQKSSTINRQHYQSVKRIFLKAIELYGVEISIPSREQVINAQDDSCYFKSLDELLSYIDKCGFLKRADYNKEKDLIIIKSIAILGWNGFLLNELPNIKKQDVIFDKDGICTIYGSNTIKTFSKMESGILNNLYYLTQYNGFPSGRTIYINNDNYFISSNTVQKAANIICTLKRFNSKVSDGRYLYYKALYKNCIFTKMYEDKSPISIRKKIIKHMECSIDSANNYVEQYKGWLNNVYKKTEQEKK